MSESEFFRIMRDRIGVYTLTVTRHHAATSAQYTVELSFGQVTYRCAGFTPAECFESILGALGFYTPATPGLHPAACFPRDRV